MIDAPESRIGKFVPILADAGGMQGEQRRSGEMCVHDDGSIRAGEWLRSYDYTEKIRVGNAVRTLVRQRFLVLRRATGIRGPGQFGRWRRAPGFLGAREPPPPKEIACPPPGEAYHFPGRRRAPREFPRFRRAALPTT